MPLLSRVLVRASLVHLTLGFTFGAILLTAKAMPLPAQTWRLLPVHVELMLTGWIVQLAMGVAYDMLPRFAHGQRGRPAAAWMALLLLNGGIGLVAFSALTTGAALPAAVGRLCEVGAAAAFAVHAWPRVKPLGA